MRHTRTTLSKALCGAFIAALIAGVPLKAQDKEIRYGVQASIVSPSGNLSYIASLGFGAAFSAEMALNETMAIRAKVDYILFGGKNESYSLLGTSYETKNSASSIAVMGDFIYRLDFLQKGLYGAGGIGFVNNSSKVEEKTPLGSFSVSGSDSGLAYSIGAGYDINSKMGFEAKYLSGPVGLDWIQLSFNYRF
jgi:opacity protein-like surface antigen